jgi:hypothetical protein
MLFSIVNVNLSIKSLISYFSVNGDRIRNEQRLNKVLYVKVYFLGEITSSGLGYPVRAGPSYRNGSRPGSGGGHGGNGGRALYQLQSPLAYDSIYTPIEAGSGGGGAPGGGIIYINVSNLFRVEGNVRANGFAKITGGEYRNAVKF